MTEILQCSNCGYETTEGSPIAVTMDGWCPECGEYIDPDTEINQG